MKKFIIVLLVLGALGYLAKTGDRNQGKGGDNAPEVIKDPVFAVIRFRTEIHDHSLQSVLLAKAVDEADCRHRSDREIADVKESEQDARSLKWTLVSSECRKDLDSRNLRLFDNQPTFANYISAARGAPEEREARWIIWGVTAEEGNRFCELTEVLQKKRRGAVNCIHALATR